MNKYNLNQHVFVYEPYVCRAVECVIIEVEEHRGLYIVESVNGENVPTIWYGRDLYETKEQCLKTEYELAEYRIKQETKKKKELKKQIDELIIKQNLKEIEKELDELKNKETN